MNIKNKKAISEIYGKLAANRDHAVKVSISLPSKVLAALDKNAALFGLSRSMYVTLLLREYLIEEPEAVTGVSAE